MTIFERIQELTTEGNKLIAEIHRKLWKDTRSKSKPQETNISSSMNFNFVQVTKQRQLKFPEELRKKLMNWQSKCDALIEAHYSKIKIKEWYDVNAKRISPYISQHYATKDTTLALTDGLKHQILYLDALCEYLKAKEIQYRSLIEAEFIQEELHQARYLLKKNYARPAGVIAGVAIERYLKLLIKSNMGGVELPPKATISTLNDMAKQYGVLDTAKWRKIQYLGDIRNKCDHDEDVENRQIAELINSVESLLKERHN